MPRTTIETSDTVQTTSEGSYKNTTGQTSGTRRGAHVLEVPSTSIKSVSPTDNTDLEFPHRYIYVGGQGDINVQFEAGTAADTFTLTVPAGGLLPLEVYSVNSTSTTATGIFLFA